MPGLELIVTTSLCAMTSAIKKIFKYLIYSILCFNCFYPDGICGSLADTVATSAETLEMPDFWMWIPFVTGHGKSWNCCSLETVPDRAHKGHWELHTGLQLSTFSDKILDMGYGKKRGAQPILSGNVKITTAKMGFMCPEKELLAWIRLDWDRKD